MNDKHGRIIQPGDTVRAVWIDTITGISVSGFTGTVQSDLTVLQQTPHGPITHTLRPISRDFQFEVVQETTGLP